MQHSGNPSIYRENWLALEKTIRPAHQTIMQSISILRATELDTFLGRQHYVLVPPPDHEVIGSWPSPALANTGAGG
jgi:hypothetical protein